MGSQQQRIEVFVQWKDGRGDIIELGAAARISHLRDVFVRRRLLLDHTDPSHAQVFLEEGGEELPYHQKLEDLGIYGQSPERPLFIKIPDNFLQQPQNATLATTLERIENKLDDLQTHQFLAGKSSESPREAWPLMVHSNGVRSRLPEDFEFPREGIYDLWLKWNIGDCQRKIPPLRILHSQDYRFLDNKPKTDESKKGSKGKFKDNRRASRKTYADIRFVCQWIEKKAETEGLDINDQGITNLRLMYEKAAPAFFEDGKASMKDGREIRWTTVCYRLRKKSLAIKKLQGAVEAEADT